MLDPDEAPLTALRSTLALALVLPLTAGATPPKGWKQAFARAFESPNSWERRAAIAERARRINADYARSSEDLARSLEGLDASWETYRDEIISVSLAMREQLSEDEWHAIAPADIDAILAHPELEE